MLQKYKKLINEKKTNLQLIEQSKNRTTEQLKELNKELKSLQETRDIFKKASIMTQNYLAKHLSSIVTKTLMTIFYEKNVHFFTEFVERRNTTECDMWIEEDGRKYDLMGSRGYSMVDIISFSLLIAYILLHDSDNVLIIDEPFRNLSSNKHEITSKMINEMSSELGIQFIISTHIEALKEHAEKSYHVIQKKGVSKIL